MVFFGENVSPFKKQTNTDTKFKKYNRIYVIQKEYDDQDVKYVRSVTIHNNNDLLV